MSKFTDSLKIMRRAKVGNIWVQTRDRYRAEALIVASLPKGYKAKVWRSSLGLYDYNPAISEVTPDKRTTNLVPTCEQLFGYQNGGPLVVMFEDIADWLKNPQAAAWVQDLGVKSKTAPPDRLVQVIVIDPAPPAEGFVSVDLEMPGEDELAAIVTGTLKMAGVETTVSTADVVSAVTGLNADQAQRAVAQCLVERKGEVDLRTIMRAKKTLIKDAAAITWIDPPEGGLAIVGGLSVVKEYAKLAEKAFRGSRTNPNIKRPKGCVVSGVPGTGKTYFSHCIGAAWQLPVLNFDISSAMGGIVGETEKNIERAIEIAKACAPCVLCLDELEKGIAGAGGDGKADGGVMNRVMDKLLKFLNNTQEPVFFVVTMNDPLKLQGTSELFRPGRFDKVFWVDVPNRKDRLEVLQIHATKKGITEVDLDVVARATRNFTGAELEALLDQATWAAQAEDRAVTTQDCLKSAKGIIPIVDMFGDKGSLAEARDWAKRGAILANDPEEQEVATVAQNILLEDEESSAN